MRSWSCEGFSEHGLRYSSAKLVSVHAVCSKKELQGHWVTATEDMALIKRMPKWLFTCVLSGVWPSCCAQHHGAGGYLAQGWSHMLLHSFTVLEPLHLQNPLPTALWDVRTTLIPPANSLQR